MIWPGEIEAWDILLKLDPKDVVTRSGALFAPDKFVYTLRCYNEDIYISLKDKDIIGPSSIGMFLLTELAEYSRLSVLGYLIHAKNLPLSGRLIKPTDMAGGDFFSKGVHVLPLDKIAKQYENDLEWFLYAGIILGGSPLEYGDASIRLFPFPHIPVVLILWAGDEEFPSKTSLLFDSSCLSHAAVDILWATAMMTIEMMLKKE